MSSRSLARASYALGLVSLCLAMSCSKNPIDAGLDAALDFSGIFKADDGTVIDVKNDDGRVTGTIVAVGTSRYTFAPVKAGDQFMSLLRANEPNTWRGSIRLSSGLFGVGTVTRTEAGFSVQMNSNEGPMAIGQSSWQSSSSTSGGGNTGGSGGSPTTAEACKSYWESILANAKWNATDYRSEWPSNASNQMGTFFRTWSLTFGAAGSSTTSMSGREIITYVNSSGTVDFTGPVSWGYDGTGYAGSTPLKCYFRIGNDNALAVQSFDGTTLQLYDYHLTPAAIIRLQK